MKCENFLKKEKILYVLENPILNDPTMDIEKEVRNEHHHQHVDGDGDEHIACVMLASISPELKVSMRIWKPILWLCISNNYLIKASGTKRYKTFKELFDCKMTNGSLVNTYVLNVIDYIEKLS